MRLDRSWAGAPDSWGELRKDDDLVGASLKGRKRGRQACALAGFQCAVVAAVNIQRAWALVLRNVGRVVLEVQPS